MVVNGIVIPDEKLIEAGWTPPKKSEYPIYKKLKCGKISGLICKFTAPTTGEVMYSPTKLYRVGYTSSLWQNHISEFWEDCSIEDIPVEDIPPEELEFDGTPIDAYVSDSPIGYKDKRVRQVIAHSKYFLTLFANMNNTKSTNTETWKYAWRIPTKE